MLVVICGILLACVHRQFFDLNKRQKKLIQPHLDQNAVLTDLCLVILLQIIKDPNILLHDKVDDHTNASMVAQSANTTDVEIPVVGQIVIDDQRHLWQIHQRMRTIICAHKNAAEK
jgi:hypothetical protein